jgi:hypothetical protein
MAAKPKHRSAKTAGQRMSERRARLRAAGLRPVQFWVPDLRNPKVLAEIRREAAELDKHPETEGINAWLDAVIDDADWT